MLGLLWYWAGVTAFLTVVDKPLLLGLLYALMVAAVPTLNVVLVSLRVAYSPSALQGRIHAASRLLGGTWMVIGPLIAGFTLEELGSRQTLVVLAASIALLGAVATAVPALRRGTPDSGSTIPSPVGGR